MEKEESSGTVNSCFKKLETKCSRFLRPSFIKRMQSCAFKKEVGSVVNDKEKVLVQVEFSENTERYSIFLLVSKQFTLFTACVWESNGCLSYVIVSDYFQHDKYAVMTFIMQLIDQIISNIRCFKNYVFFSDGAASQFKQNLPFVK